MDIVPTEELVQNQNVIESINGRPIVTCLTMYSTLTVSDERVFVGLPTRDEIGLTPDIIALHLALMIREVTGILGHLQATSSRRAV